MRHFYTRLCGILFLVSLGLLIADICTINNQLKTGGQVIALDSKQKLPVVHGICMCCLWWGCWRSPCGICSFPPCRLSLWDG